MGKFLTALLCCLLLASPVLAAGGGGHGGETKKKPKGALDCAALPADDTPFFIPMQPFVVPVFRQGQPTNFVSYRLSLEVAPQTEACEMVLKAMPRLQSDFVEYLHGVGSTKEAAKLDDLTFVKSFLLQIATRVMQEEPPLPAKAEVEGHAPAPAPEEGEEGHAAAPVVKVPPEKMIQDILFAAAYNRKLAN